MYKVFHGVSPDLMSEILPLKAKVPYSLRKTSDFTVPNIRTVNYGLHSIRYLGPKIWESIPKHMKTLESVDSFKNAIKTWKPASCPCRLC